MNVQTAKVSFKTNVKEIAKDLLTFLEHELTLLHKHLQKLKQEDTFNTHIFVELGGSIKRLQDLYDGLNKLLETVIIADNALSKFEQYKKLYVKEEE